jgi:hypothetical protein
MRNKENTKDYCYNNKQVIFGKHAVDAGVSNNAVGFHIFGFNRL